jgi:hypothetical protein
LKTYACARVIAQSVLAMRVKLSMATSILVIIVTSARQWTRRRLAADDGVLSFCCGGDAQQRGVSHLCAKACAGLVLAQAVSCRACTHKSTVFFSQRCAI